MPNGGVTSIQTVAFNQKKFEFSHSVDRSGLEVLKKIRLQRTPDKRTQKDKAGDRKSNPKPQAPSDDLKMIGVIVDAKQPLKAVAMIESNGTPIWLCVGDSLKGQFSTWSVQSISAERIRFVSGDKTDSIPLTRDEVPQSLNR